MNTQDLKSTSFIPLSKERTKELEESTVPWIMIANTCKSFKYETLGIDFHCWHTSQESIHDALYKKVAAISDKIGLKQTYYVNYTSRNAVWGLDYNGTDMVLYYSNEGLSLQLPQGTSCKALTEILEVFIGCWKK